MKKRILTLAVLAMVFTSGCSSNSDMKALEGTWMGEEGGIVFYEPMEKMGFLVRLRLLMMEILKMVNMR